MSACIINGRESSIDEKDFINFHGNSVFTTLRSKNGDLFLWREHWQRLSSHAKFFGYEMPDEDHVNKILEPHIQFADQKIRIVVSENNYAITIEPYTPPNETIYHGVDVIESAWQAHPVLTKFKTGNSLPYQQAQKEAEAKGVFEALITNQAGFVVDGSRTSVLHYDGKKLISLDGGLDGCMRQHVMKTLAAAGIKCETKYLRMNDLNHQILLTNSLVGVVPVAPIRFSEVRTMVETFRQN